MENAITHRLAKLRAQYRAFVAKPDARILHWLLASDERRMVDALLATERDARTSELGDLFVELRAPFRSAERHGRALRRELEQAYAESASEPSAEAAVKLDWRPPAEPHEGSGICALAEAARSLAEHHADLLAHLTLVLVPPSVADPCALCAWLDALAAALPASVRVVILDQAGAPLLRSREHAAVEVWHTVCAALDMEGAYMELCDGRPDDRSPASELRRAFMRTLLATRRGDAEAAATMAVAGLQIAERERWWDLGASLLLAVGTAQATCGRHTVASGYFQQARLHTERAVATGSPAGRSLLLHAHLAGGRSALLDGRQDEAAREYEGAALRAEAEQDLATAHEALRMLSHVRASAGHVEGARHAALRALELGERLPESDRACSTLRYTGAALLELLARDDASGESATERARLEARLDAALGEGWKARLGAPALEREG